MEKEDRIKYLTKLTKSNEGVALKEYLQELIDKLVDARNYSKEDFELEGKASIKAAAILQQILTRLKLLEKPKGEPKKNQYI